MQSLRRTAGANDAAGAAGLTRWVVYGIQERTLGNPTNMKIAACLLMSAGLCSAVLADEPPSPAAQSPAAQSPAAQPPAAEAPATSAAPSAGDANAAPGASANADTKTAGTPAAQAPKADKGGAVNADATEAEIKQMRSRGYKPVTRNGTLVFCRDEGELGSHFQRTRCSTLKQLKDAELSGKEYVNSLQRSADPFKGP